MQVYFTDDYAFESNEELKRNALLLYPYIHNNTISHGRAAEILGIKSMGTIGVLGTAFEEKIISKSEIKSAIEILRNSVLLRIKFGMRQDFTKNNFCYVVLVAVKINAKVQHSFFMKKS